MLIKIYMQEYLKISKEGLMYLTFQNDEIESEYYMVPQEDGVM